MITKGLNAQHIICETCSNKFVLGLQVRVTALEASVEVAEYNLLCERQILRMLGSCFKVAQKWESAIMNANWKEYSAAILEVASGV